MNESHYICFSQIHMNKSCRIWMSHVTYDWVKFIWMSHVTCEWDTSDINLSSHHVWLSLWDPQWVSLCDQCMSCRIYVSHKTQICTLQCVAVCCSVLQCVAVCCSVLQCDQCMSYLCVAQDSDVSVWRICGSVKTAYWRIWDGRTVYSLTYLWVCQDSILTYLGRTYVSNWHIWDRRVSLTYLWVSQDSTQTWIQVRQEFVMTSHVGLTARKASWRRGFDPYAPLLFNLYHYLEQSLHFGLVPENRFWVSRGRY